MSAILGKSFSKKANATHFKYFEKEFPVGGQKKTFYLMETEGHQRGTTRFVFYGYPIF